MIHITSLDDGLETFKALGSDTRIQILNILLENEQMSMNQLATELNISNGALTGHIKKLEECGLINISNESAGHGNQKMCSVTQDRIIVDIKKPLIIRMYSRLRSRSDSFPDIRCGRPAASPPANP